MRAQLSTLLTDALAALAGQPGFERLAQLDTDPQLERTRDARHGDFTSNIALRLAGAVGVPPRDLAARIVETLPNAAFLESVAVAGPGFINFRLSLSAYQAELLAILDAASAYGRSESGRGTRLLIEYVSANPTGPLHVGHGRLAAFGASLAHLLRATGFEVEEEYYVNDAGRQMDILAASVWLRYADLCGHTLPFPEKAYQGAYCREIATALRDEHGSALLGPTAAILTALAGGHDDAEAMLDALIEGLRESIGANAFAIVHAAALERVLDDIRDDLAAFGIEPGRWYSEASLSESGAIERALDDLERRGHLYEKDGAKWFRTSDFGDDKDRVVVRDNGVTTYFASDIAYHREKCERGYDRLLNVLGSDHHGYVPRLRAALEALGQPPDKLEVELVQFVVLYRGKEKVQMSTRAGEYVTLRELREEVGNDACRFFYVSRSNDQHLDFDLDLAKSQSNDNPIYYVQYAHARISSMLARLREAGYPVPKSTDGATSALTETAEKSLMKQLSRYAEVVELAAANHAPQGLVHYLRDLAAEFHSYYNAHRIIVDDAELRTARILLALATQRVLKNALEILGVSAPDNM
jgi:arginyl-tRNA synthetase